MLRLEEIKNKFYLGYQLIKKIYSEKTAIHSKVILEKFVFHLLQQHLFTLEKYFVHLIFECCLAKMS